MNGEKDRYGPEALDYMAAREFKFGDMVWGKVKSHPWWPGQIYDEALARAPVLTAKVEGHLLVAFFGDSSYGWLHPADLIPFEPHFREKSQQASSPSFNIAIDEAIEEACRRVALGLACHCGSPFNFRPTRVPGFVSVNVAGYEPGGVYSIKQIDKARESVIPAQVLSFLHQLALAPQPQGSEQSIDWIKSKAMLLALRRSRFEEFDETYAQAFGVQPIRPSSLVLELLDQPDNSSIRGRLWKYDRMNPTRQSINQSKEINPEAINARKEIYMVQQIAYVHRRGMKMILL